MCEPATCHGTLNTEKKYEVISNIVYILESMGKPHTDMVVNTNLQNPRTTNSIQGSNSMPLQESQRKNISLLMNERRTNSRITHAMPAACSVEPLKLHDDIFQD